VNAKELYLAWVRSNYPQQYISALRKVASKPRSLGGLGDDLTASFISPDVQTMVDTSQVSPDVTAAIDNATQTSGAASVFDSITNALSNVAQTYLQTSAQQNLLSVNTQRARQGLPPLTANGVPVTAASLAPANSSIYMLERRIAGAVSPNFLIFGGLALVGFLMLGRRRA
jgi:hypothetical protein